MAIIVEEEKQQESSLVNVIGWLVMLVIVGVAVYYILFAAAAPAIITPPAGFQAITAMSQINFNPQGVTQNQTFQSLKQYVAEPTSTGPAAVGRTNPFASP